MITWLAWVCIVAGALVLAVCIGTGKPAEWIREVVERFRRKPAPVETEWERQMRELNKAFNQMFISCGNALRPPLEGFAKDLATLFNAIAESLESGSENES